MMELNEKNNTAIVSVVFYAFIFLVRVKYLY